LTALLVGLFEVDVKDEHHQTCEVELLKAIRSFTNNNVPFDVRACNDFSLEWNVQL
jgi:hypothetical protein